MGSIDSYIFRQTFAAFILVLVTLTGVIWITQALRGIDVMTSQGQTVLVFVGLTGLAIPYLVLVIAPIALVISVAYVLNKLSTDSEIIVMNAAGMRPWRLFRPFLLVTIVVSAMVFLISAYVAPDGLRRLKSWQREITADVLSNVLQTGKVRRDRAQSDLAGSRTAARRIAGRNFHRRPARPEGTGDDHRRTRHGSEERHRLVPDPGRRQSATLRGRPARSGFCRVRP